MLIIAITLLALGIYISMLSIADLGHWRLGTDDKVLLGFISGFMAVAIAGMVV